MGVPSRYAPAFTSISFDNISYRSVVVTILIVGTKGKLVMEPLPVTKKIMLEPDATCPAMLSKSLPGLSMK